MDEFNLNCPFELLVTATEPPCNAFPSTRHYLETITDSNVFMKLKFLLKTNEFHLANRLYLLNECRKIRHGQDLRDQFRVKKPTKSFQRHLHKDIRCKHRAENLLAVVVGLPVRINIVYPPDPAHRKVAYDAVLLAVIAEFKLVKRSGLNGTDDIRAR